MAKCVTIQIGDKKCKYDLFSTAKERDEEAKALERKGWKVKVGKHKSVIPSRGEYYWYRAEK